MADDELHLRRQLRPPATKRGLFYYYCAFAKVMNQPTARKKFVDGKGQRHNWRNELARSG